MTLVVHPHFHGRRTGATRHIEMVVPGLARTVDARTLGGALEPEMPRIGWRELLRRARKEPVVWHAHRNHEVVAGHLLRLVGRRVRVVFTRHASMPPSALTRWLARTAHRLISLTPEIAQVMGVPSVTVAHGTDLARFLPPADRAASWRRLGLGGAYGAGVVGRIRREKGQGDFVEAIAPLLGAHPEWRPVLVGLAKGPDEAWAQELKAKTGDLLALPGEQYDVAPWYQGLSVVVHPSYTEGFSMVHLEALASGCCVVSSRLPYVDDVIEHGRTGFVFEPGDVAGLREILRLLMREPERAAEVGRNAAEEARLRFGVEHEVRALLDIYRSVL